MSEPTEQQIKQRIDVRKNKSAYTRYLSPQFLPIGKWPSPQHRPLVFSQQLLSILFFKKLAWTGLFSINGPQEQEKTTLLRDIIANLVVERALKLVNFKQPQDAFQKSLSWASGRYFRDIPVLDFSITGYEMIVASNNNSAVENITLEIPGSIQLIKSWLDKTNYFKEFSQNY